jgi:hypothetical protein
VSALARRIRVEDVALALLVLATTLVVFHFGLRNHSMQFDELLAVIGGRHIEADFPSALWQWGLLDRGPERLGSIVLAGIGALVGDRVGEIEVGRFVFALIASLTAVPAVALARGLGVGRWAALAAGALAILTPWAVFGATWLNTAAGTLTAGLLLWAMYHATVRPSVRADLLVLAAFALASLGRVGHMPLVLAMAAAVPVIDWRDRPARVGAVHWLRGAPGRIARAHPLLCACAVAGLLVVLAKGQSGILGAYGQGIGNQPVQPDRVWLQLRTIVARSAEAFAVFPFVVAAWWLLSQAVRPRSREAGAFAVLSLAAFVALLYVLLSATIEDRYIAPLAVPIAVAFVAAVALRQISVVGVLVIGALVGRAISTVGAPSDEGPYSFFVAPGAQVLRRAIALRLDSVLPLGGHPLTVVIIACVALAAGLAVVLRRAPAARWPVTAALAATIAVTAAGGVYAAQKWTTAATYPTRTREAQTFVDRATGGAPAAYYVNPALETEDLRLRLLEVEYNNRSLLGSLVPAGRMTVFYCCAPRPLHVPTLKVDRRSGAVAVIGGSMPRYIVVPTGWAPTGLAARRVAVGEPAMAVEELRSGPARLAFATAGGTYENGWQKPGATTRVRVFPGAAGRQPACVSLTLNAPALVPGGSIGWSADTGAQRLDGKLPQGTGAVVRLRLPDARATMLRIRSQPAGTVFDGRPGGVLATDVAVAPCDERPAGQ